MKRHVSVLLALLLLALAAPERPGFANMATGVAGRLDREVVLCYFGALRKDGNIMVNLVPGAAGQVYPVLPGVPVTLNGTSVGLKYLLNGMPVALFLNGRKVVELIQVRPAAGGR